MEDVEIAHINSDGGFVIPRRLSRGFRGRKALVIRNDKRLIVEPALGTSKRLKEELEFARRTEEAWKEIEAGKGVTMDFNKFLEEAERW